MAEFGCSPASRGKVKAVPPSDDDPIKQRPAHAGSEPALFVRLTFANSGNNRRRNDARVRELANKKHGDSKHGDGKYACPMFSYKLPKFKHLAQDE